MIENLVKASIKNCGQSFHWHEEVELNFVLKGTAVAIINDSRIPLSASDIIVTNCEVAHCIEKNSDDLIYAQLQFNMEKFDQYIPDISMVIFQCGPKDNDVMSENLKDEIKEHIANIIDILYFNAEEINKEQKIIYSCMEILSSLKMGFKYGTPEQIARKEEYKWDRMWKIIEYMYDNCCRKLPLKEVADYVFLSEVYLSRFIKSKSGRSFEELLTFIRSETSIRYLLDDEMSITNIAYECGFSAPRYYNTAFEKYYGCSPADWRKKNRPYLAHGKSIKPSSVLIDDEVDTTYVQSLLKKYIELSTVDKEPTLTIDVDISQRIHENTEAFYHIDSMSCSAEQAMDYDTKEVFEECKDLLHIHSVALKGKSGKLTDLAAVNIKKANLQLLAEEEGDNCVELDELFYNSQLKTWGFYKHQILANIGTRYNRIGENAGIYKIENEINVLVHSFDNNRRFIVNITGLEAEKTYLCKKQITRQVPEEIEVAFRQGKIDNNVNEYLKPETEIDILKKGIPLIIEMELPRGHICNISITPIN